MSLIKINESSTLWENISFLPFELKAIIGQYSTQAAKLRAIIKYQFFKHWTMENLDRLIELVRKNWTKKQVVWLFMSMEVYNHTHYSCMNKETLIIVLHEQLRFNGRHERDNKFNVAFARLTWQRLKAIEITISVFEQRKRSIMKQKRDKAKAEKEEEYLIWFKEYEEERLLELSLYDGPFGHITE